MRIKYLSLLFFSLISFINLMAQTNCPKYDNAINKGKAHLSKKTPDFEEALKEFQLAQIAARECSLDEQAGKVAAKELQRVFRGLQKQSKDAIENAKRAREAETKAKNALAAANAEKEKAKAALQKALEANERVVDAFLRDAQKHIYNLEHDEALEKIHSAAGLNVKQAAIFPFYLEVAYWHNESGETQRALGILDTATALINKPEQVAVLGTSPTRNQVQKVLQQLDAAHYQFLQERYYPTMVAISGGTFEMGCDTLLIDNNSRNDERQHSVTVSDYKLAATETTWWQYRLFCKATGHDYETPSWQIQGDNPAVNVSWFDATLYLNWLSEQNSLDSVYILENKREGDVQMAENANGFRLPTEAQWEYAAKGGAKKIADIYSGSNELEEVGWFYENSNNRTQSVGQKKPNKLDVYDMSGNVWEWCSDWYGTYTDSSEPNPQGAESGSDRVLRGGSWDDYAHDCRVANRSNGYPGIRISIFGFRVSHR